VDLFSLFGGFFSFRFYLLRLFETRRSGLVRVCCRGRGRDCITQVRRCLTGRLPTLTNSLYLHRLVVSKETVREVMQNTVNKPNKNSIKKKHGHTHRHNKKKREWGSALVCASCVWEKNRQRKLQCQTVFWMMLFSLGGVWNRVWFFFSTFGCCCCYCPLLNCVSDPAGNDPN
jgi:hypothetical protein